MLTRQDSHWHKQYEDASPAQRSLVDRTYNAVREEFIAYQVRPANDDRAEALVAAIFRYYVESTEGGDNA